MIQSVIAVLEIIGWQADLAAVRIVLQPFVPWKECSPDQAAALLPASGCCKIGRMSDFHITLLPPDDTRHDAAILELIDQYAQIEIIHGKPLGASVKQQMLPGFRGAGGLIFVALAGSENGEPIGVATVMPGFSTFYARPLLNVHDLVVARDWQGNGVGSLLLEAVESHARETGCCKVTLEVLASNPRAHALYQRLGYDRGIDGGKLEASYFMQKPLTRLEP